MRLRMQDIDNQLASMLGSRKIQSQALPSSSSPSNRDNRAKQKATELDHSEQWRRWSGNYPIPSDYAEIIPPANSRSMGKVGEYISIPFKPLFWVNLLSLKKENQSAANIKPFGLPTDEPGRERAGSGAYAAYQENFYVMEDYLSRDAFLRCAVPWLFIFLYEGVNDLEDVIVEETYADKQIILKEGDPMALTIIRYVSCVLFVAS